MIAEFQEELTKIYRYMIASKILIKNKKQEYRNVPRYYEWY